MINGIGPTGTGRVDNIRSQATQRGAPAGKSAEVRTIGQSAPSNPAADLAASGPPVDSAKVAAIQAAMATGTYAVDTMAIAEKMMALDLPVKA